MTPIRFFWPTAMADGISELATQRDAEDQKNEETPMVTPKKKDGKDGEPTPMKRPAAKTPSTPQKKPATRVPTPKKEATPKKTATPKPKAGKMKKPGSKVMKVHTKTKKTEEKNTPKPKPKPKAKGKSSGSGKATPAQVWSQPLVKEADTTKEGEEEEVVEQDPEVNPFDGDIHKDRSKNKKFQLMLQSGGLPQFVTAEWERTLSMKTGKQDAQRKLVNSVFQKKDGKVCLDTPYVAQLKDHTQSKILHVYIYIYIYIFEFFFIYST